MKLTLEVPAAFAATAKRFYMPPELLGKVLCEVFHHEPPSELVLTAQSQGGVMVHRIVPRALPSSKAGGNR